MQFRPYATSFQIPSRPCWHETSSRSRKVGWRVALVGLDHLAGIELHIGVGRVDDLSLAIVDDSQGRKALVRAELTRPAGANGVWTADTMTR